MPPPESPELPDRAALGELILDLSEACVAGPTDLSTYFYSLVEEWMVGLQGLPPVWVPAATPVSGRYGWLYPALGVAAMENSHSIVIA